MCLYVLEVNCDVGFPQFVTRPYLVKIVLIDHPNAGVKLSLPVVLFHQIYSQNKLKCRRNSIIQNKCILHWRRGSIRQNKAVLGQYDFGNQPYTSLPFRVIVLISGTNAGNAIAAQLWRYAGSVHVPMQKWITMQRLYLCRICTYAVGQCMHLRMA